MSHLSLEDFSFIFNLVYLVNLLFDGLLILQTLHSLLGYEWYSPGGFCTLSWSRTLAPHIFPSFIEVYLTNKSCTIYSRCTMWCFVICILCKIITKIRLIRRSITLHSGLFVYVRWEHLRSILLANCRYTIQYY